LPLFLERLKDGPAADLPEALVFETGANRWRRFAAWPPKVTAKALYLNPDAKLSFRPSKSEKGSVSFVSDPAHPVPSTTEISIKRRREMMTEDQRSAGRRPDVLSFQTEVLSEDVTLAGPMEMELWVSTDQTAADWVVKVIDVYPGDEPVRKVDDTEFSLGDAQLLVRYEIFRGRYRKSFEKPEPFVPNQVTKVPIKLPDVCHTFARGHRLMIQVQSSYFPFFDRNPQTYVDNIFEAKAADFSKANHSVWYGSKYPSRLKVGVLNEEGL